MRAYYTNLTGHSPDPTFHRLLNARTPYPTDDAHGLTLVKLVSPDQPLFSWLKCRSGSPATGQRLQFFDAERQPRGVSAVEAGQPLPKPLVGNDAFVVETSTAWVVPLGTALMSVENELQGITIGSGGTRMNRDLPDNQTLNRHIAIPAVHIEKLVNDYRKTTSRVQAVRPDSTDGLQPSP